ncbi:hypothetical protein D4R42_05115 [bacterium]|nr:MAG: hypothetical protein D4R42_05115 [bacterium]
MQIKKKILSSTIIALLVLSVVATALPAFAVNGALIALYEPAAVPTVLHPGNGPVGDRVEVVGTAGAANPFNTVNVYWNSIDPSNLIGLGGALADGSFMVNVTIPSAVNGAVHNIVVTDGVAPNVGLAFTVDASLSAGRPPVRVLPADAVTLTGHGFGAAKTVTITMIAPNTTTTVPITTSIITNGTGSFTAIFTVPTTLKPVDFSTTAWTVRAIDSSTVPVVANTSVFLEYYVNVSPTSGPTGITVTIAGRIPPNKVYSINFGSAVGILQGTSGADGAFSGTYTITGPIIVGGSYAATVFWDAATQSRTAIPAFTGTASPIITAISSSMGVAGSVITFSGSGFTMFASITLKLGATVANSTATDSRFALAFFTTGFTNLQFTVPAISPGVYVLEVVDQYGATTGNAYTFRVTLPPATNIALRGTSYYPGDTLSFNIFTTDTMTSGPTCTIRDPTGSTWWTATWPLTAIGPTWSVLYQNQRFVFVPAILPADAPLGTWNWTITYQISSIPGVPMKTTGLFNVTALPTMQTVISALNANTTTILSQLAGLGVNITTLGTDMTALDAKIASVATSTEGAIIAVINTKAGQITTKIDALNPKITALTDSVVVLATMLGELQVDIAALDLDALGVDITAIKGDVATIRTNLGTVTTAVSNLDAKVTALSGDVATVSTTLGTLQGTVTSIDGKVATVNTSVGTLQADISDIKAKPGADMTPVWIAVVLSLIAAIAAIFAVVTIRQKIAG